MPRNHPIHQRPHLWKDTCGAAEVAVHEAEEEKKEDTTPLSSPEVPQFFLEVPHRNDEYWNARRIQQEAEIARLEAEHEDDDSE